jgi:hypothetical protein
VPNADDEKKPFVVSAVREWRSREAIPDGKIFSELAADPRAGGLTVLLLGGLAPSTDVTSILNARTARRRPGFAQRQKIG